MNSASIANIARKRLDERFQQRGVIKYDYSNILLTHSVRPSPIESTVYRPLLCVVLQGAKEVFAGNHKVTCGKENMILVSHHLPVTSRIIKASRVDPYIAAILPLDRAKLRHYFDPTKVIKMDGSSAAIACYTADPEILNAIGRLLALEEGGEIAPLIAPLIEDEIHARLLHSSMSAMLTRLMWHDDKSTQIARVIKLISDDLAKSLPISELANTVGMSKSSLHLHFKAVTGMTPLAYTKELRLLKAQTFVRDSNQSISMIGYEVGYESATQFSREYTRKFNISPSRDRASTR